MRALRDPDLPEMHGHDGRRRALPGLRAAAQAAADGTQSTFLLRGIAAAGLAGAALGAFWGWALPGSYGFFGIFLGLGLGYGVAESTSLATNRKSGPILQAIAVLGVVLAYIVRNLVIDAGILPGRRSLAATSPSCGRHRRRGPSAVLKPNRETSR